MILVTWKAFIIHKHILAPHIFLFSSFILRDSIWLYIFLNVYFSMCIVVALDIICVIYQNISLERLEAGLTWPARNLLL